MHAQSKSRRADFFFNCIGAMLIILTSCSFSKRKPASAEFTRLDLSFVTDSDVCYDLIIIENKIWIACALKNQGIIHFDGTEWKLEKFNGPPFYATQFSRDHEGNLFVVGKNALYAEFKNGVWNSQRATPLKTGSVGTKTYYDFSDFYDVKPHDGGFIAVSAGNEIRLPRFKNGSWDFLDLTPSGLDHFPLRIFVDGADFAVSGSARIAFNIKNEWTSQKIPYPKGWIFDLEGTSLNDLWMAGYWKPIFGKEDALFHYDGKTFTRHRLPQKQPVYGLHVVSHDEAYAVGHKGSVSVWNGKSWRDLESGVENSLYAVHKTADGYLYIVGDRGLILKSNHGLNPPK